MSKKKSKGSSVSKKAGIPKIFIIGGLFTLTLILYGNTLWNGFALDDAIVITDNEFTQKGFAGLLDIFSKDSFHGFFGEAGKDKLVKGGRYRPFTLAMFAVERAVFGTGPMMHHLINVLLYALSGIMIFLLSKVLTRKVFTAEVSVVIAATVAALFIAHPLHTEVVANIKGRDEMMAFLGSITALYIYCKYEFGKIPLSYLSLAVIAFLIGLLSKENAITFVVVIPVVAYLFYQKSAVEALRASVPIFFSAAVFLILRTAVIGWDMGAEPSTEFMNNPYLKVVNNQYLPFTFHEKMATISYTLFKYLQLLVVPHPLTHDYYPNHISVKTFANPLALSGLVLYIALGIAAIIGLLKRKKWAIFPLFYLVTLSIVSNILFPVGTHMSERFVYIPSLAFSGIIAVLLFSRKYIKQRGMAVGILILIMLGYSYKTVTRNGVWKDNFTLFTTDALTSIRSAKVNNAAGGVILDNLERFTNEDEKALWIKKAHEHLSIAIAEHPNYLNAYLLKGNAFFYEQNFDEAIKYYNLCLSIDPSYAEASNNIFLTYRSAGRYYGEKENNLARSLDYLLKAIALQPGDFETNRLLGTCYGIMGNHIEAVKYFRRCAEMQPENPGIFQSLGQALELIGDIQGANDAYLKAQSLNNNK